MATQTAVMEAVTALNYRVTIGDVAAKSGLELNTVQRELATLAAEAGGHLQVAESGEVVYQFPTNFEAILRNRSWRLQMQARLQKLWQIIFYLIRLSFGIALVVSIIIIFTAIIILVLAQQSQEGEERERRSGGDLFALWQLQRYTYLLADWSLFFDPIDYDRRPHKRRSQAQAEAGKLNFLEAVYSFLFGDGNPNADLEERRWQMIATTISNHKGGVVAEQIAPYLDDLGSPSDQEYETYMLPVLARFDGRPQVSPEGGLVYHFPSLQVRAKQARSQRVSDYLREHRWPFTQATPGQAMGVIILAAVNLGGALILGGLLQTNPADLQGFVGFVQSIYWLLLGYGVGVVVVPLVRYFWLQLRNRRVEARNWQRSQRTLALRSPSPALERKLRYAQQFATEVVISDRDIIYATDRDLLEQEAERLEIEAKTNSPADTDS
ncbi:hypothetical protein OOK60_07540 [Trichothermofontia sichuanensis B231]|uniref:hypothetical protein n=1 Tax=Trichothermofontia sichuanensis TaxID=3045816 RepID=UPI002246652F|nr:hypothetical protein [Trichothermofontia sichuanensis]UZQ55905.1 hypothetical protein OOK60_07540 [Trichothermofontia sichuanensis B231]